MKQTFAIGIGGAAGQVRGGHTFLTIRTGPDKVTNMGDWIDLLVPLNQDSMDRHLKLLGSGAACLYNADIIKPGPVATGVLAAHHVKSNT